MKVRILNEDGTAYKTRIIDVETGKDLEYIGRVEMNFDASSGPITARLTQYWVALDIIADAEIKHVCALCGRPVDKEDSMEGLAVGRMVHYVLENGEHRAAVVVRVFEPYGKEAGLANLIVFSDGSNDARVVSGNVSEQGLFWATSAHYDPEGTKHHTWHWPERV